MRWSLFVKQLFYEETPTQVFSCKYCEIFTSTYFEEHLQTPASGLLGHVLNDTTCM